MRFNDKLILTPCLNTQQLSLEKDLFIWVSFLVQN